MGILDRKLKSRVFFGNAHLLEEPGGWRMKVIETGSWKVYFAGNYYV